MYTLRLVSFALVVAFASSSSLLAQVKSFELSGDYADFEMHPETGDVIALDAEAGQVLHYKVKSREISSEPTAKLRVGTTPVSITYKEFNGKKYFAVVCSQDAHLYLINADDFSLLTKIALNQSGVSFVTASVNTNDPFIYYCYGSGHDSKTGVVSLVDMKNKGIAFDSSMDCAISASGKLAYRRGPWSPSGFESLTLTSSFGDDKPTFARLFYDHNSTSQYVPDPFDQFTAAGKRIFTCSLEKSVAELDFLPLAFFRDRPIVAGIEYEGGYRPGGFPGSSNEKDLVVTLKLASYNTFASLGENVKLTIPAPKSNGELPRGTNSQADFKSMAKRSRLFSDAKRDQLVYASRNGIWFVPMTEFKAPEEPFLRAELKGADQVYAGQECKLTLVPSDKKVEIVFDDMPEGMKRDGNILTWTPDKDAIGPTGLQITLKHADIQRSMKFDINVSYPSHLLPFSPSDMAVDEKGEVAVIWEGVQLDQFQRPIQTQTQNQSVNSNRIAAIDLKNGKVKAERKLATAISKVSFGQKHIYLWTLDKSPKLDVLNISDLQLAKSLAAGGMIHDVSVMGGLLILQTAEAVEVYNVETFAKLRTFPGNGRNQFAGILNVPGCVTPYGLYVQQVLYDLQLKPKMLLGSNGLPTLAGGDLNYQPTFLGKLQNSSTQNQAYAQMGHETGRSPVASVQVPGSKTKVTLSRGVIPIQVPGSVHTFRSRVELVVDASGDDADQQTLVRKDNFALNNSQPPMPILKTTQDRALVIEGQNIYQWKFTASKEDAKAEQGSEKGDLQFVPQQSALTLDKSGKTILSHKATGGSSPVRFSLLSTYDGFDLDENSGTLTINNEKLMAAASDFLEKHLMNMSRGQSLIDTLRSNASSMLENAMPMLGRRPNGVPVAIPIRIDASDANLGVSKMQYFVIAEIPSKEFMEHLKEKDKAREAEIAMARERALAKEQSMAKAQAEARQRLESPETRNEVADADDSNAELSRRIEALENRIDLMTRQMSEILKKLDQR